MSGVYVFESVCLHCGGLFPRNRGALYCSETCGNKFRNRKWRAENKEKIRVKNFKASADTVSRIYTRIKSKCKSQGIPFNLEKEDIVVPDICPVLGIPLLHHSGRKGYHPQSPSVDRIDSSLGYIKGNVRVISARANLLKNNATLEELELILEDARRIRDG